MDLLTRTCPCCATQDFRIHTRYKTVSHGERSIFNCVSCDVYFSETYGTPIAKLTTPLSRVIQILKVRSRGMSLNAVAQEFQVSKKTVIGWEHRLGHLKPTLLVYSLLQNFIHQEIEGDELYTKVHHNTAASASVGWTIVLIERSSRFLWELNCGKKDETLFRRALEILVKVIEQTDSLSLLTDGERRYGNLLFSICHEIVQDGTPGRPPKKMKKGVRVRLKNKGRQKGTVRSRKKYESPVPEHPDTAHTISESEIHANHAESFNASLRRNNSAFRRKTNTYAKSSVDLQRTLDVYWVIHNVVRVHFTTKVVPAVKLGILEIGLSWEQLFTIQYAV